ncbi:MAG TPA: hypothetical protein VG323_08600 [Thermoanaerobaculia bacterium]|nr:hypothetical protein [Thermoanaerobaculia bacterium]
MLVELDIFSGRPNPRWRLGDAEAARVRELIDALAPAPAAAPPEPPGLGYRGFRIDDVATAYSGVVRMRGRVLADPQRRVERFLLEHLPPEHEYIRSAIGSELA